MAAAWRVWKWAGVGVLWAAVAAQAQQAGVPAGAPSSLPPVAVERFFAPAAMYRATLSSSGRWLAALASLPGRRIGLQMIDLRGEEAPRFIEAAPDADLVGFQWVNDDWLLAYRGARLLALRRDGSSSRVLTGGDGALLSLGKPGSLDVLVGYGRYDVRGELMYTRVRAIDITTGDSRLVYEDAPRASQWWFDGQGRPRLVSQESETEIVYHWADARGDDTGSKAEHWREIGRTAFLDPAWVPAYVEGEDKLFVMTFDAQGYTELRRFDFGTGKPAATAVLTTPGFSTGIAPRREVRGGPLIGVDVSLDATTTEWFTPGMKALQDRVDARFPGRVNILQCRPCDKPGVVLVFSHADTDPGQFLLFRPAEDKWQLVGAVRPDLEAQRMARLEFHRIRARDGSDLPVWVTRPQLPPGSPPPPAVVLVHGGPHLRGASWRWDADAQFLASRGYVVIQPEFRGSTGYGHLHYKAGWKQWGAGMIDDITDAFRHAVVQGWVDGRKACIMGSSYGGYATLMSLAKEPALYRCGIAHAAVTDPRHRFDFHWSDLSAIGRRVVLPLTMGDPKKDAAMMIEQSPLEQVQRIKAPLLLMHGDDDYRVPLENGERMRDALKKHGKDFEWVLYVDEGHGFAKRENLLDHWRRVEAFLARHLR